MRKPSGFTLIELMLVTAMISVVAAILLPLLLRMRAEQRKPRPAAAAAVEGESETSRRDVDLLSANLTVSLHSRPVRVGMEMHSDYEASLEAHFRFQPVPSESLGPRRVELSLPFPEGTGEVLRASLARVDADGSLHPLETARFTARRIVWQGYLPDQPTQILVLTQLRGRDRFHLLWPQAARRDNLLLTVKATPPGALGLANGSLPPTAQTRSAWTWEYEHLLDERTPDLRLAAGDNPEGQVLLLCRWVGLAVLLFGFGLWYLGELDQPGRMSEFRGGQFLLLALTYSFYFPALAALVLTTSLSLVLCQLIAGLLSIPLLVFHAQNLFGSRFAWLRVLPLGLFTLAVVLNGVFSPASSRVLIELAFAFLALSLITVTSRRWNASRHRYQTEKLKELQDRSERLVAQAALAGERVLQTEADLTGAPTALVNQRERLNQLITDSERLGREAAGLTHPVSVNDRFQQVPSLTLRCELLELRLPQELSSYLSLCSQHRRRSTSRHTQARSSDQIHCAHCGQRGPTSPYCAACGQAHPERLSCACGTVLSIPRASLEQGHRPSFCTGCGNRFG